MGFSLNSAQAKSLSGLFFDVAKGLLFGGIGLAVTTPAFVRVVVVVLASFFAFWCVRMGLSLLENVE